MSAALAVALAMVPSRLLTFEDFSGWTHGDHVLSREVDPDMEWNEAILSWNLVLKPGASARFFITLPAGKRYCMGVWSADPATPSTSLKGEADSAAKVDTDTLIAQTPQRQLKLEVEWAGFEPECRMMGVSLANRTIQTDPLGDRAAWGKVISAPQRAQMNYPNGNVICSATSNSMVLAHWAKVLERPALDEDVPAVCRQVFDKEWNGTGNWSFNAAYAGSLPGMRAMVSRFWGIGHLEQWIAKGLPVVCSVSYTLLKGQEKKPNDGHLVVLVGFTPEGDPIFNDPGKNVVRMTYARADFERAWAYSGRTVYLIVPRWMGRPANTDGCWW